MADRNDDDVDGLLLLLREMPPEDQDFLKRLIVELARREQSGSIPADEWILHVTREIAPGRVSWVQRQLGL